MSLLEFKLCLKPGERAGLRINQYDEVCNVHPDTVAHSAGLQINDVVTAVDGQTCRSVDGATALQLWAKGTDRSERTLAVRRQGVRTETSTSQLRAAPTATPVTGATRLIDFELRLDGAKSGLRLSSDNTIVAVHSGSKAHSAGLQVGDVVLEVDSRPCSTPTTGAPTTSSTTAVQLWSQGRSLTVRRLKVRRAARQFSQPPSAATPAMAAEPTFAGGSAPLPTDGLTEVIDFELRLDGAKSGLRLSSDNTIVAVHEGTKAHTAGLRVGDVVVGVDANKCLFGVTAMSLWAKGKDLPTRRAWLRDPNCGCAIPTLAARSQLWLRDPNCAGGPAAVAVRSQLLAILAVAVRSQ